MTTENSKTLQYLRQWHGGDPKGLEALLERHLPWIENHVRKRMGPLLRGKGETQDYVQDAMIQFLRYGPKIILSSDDHFRALIVRIVENSLRDKHDWFTAKRRAISKERPLPSDTMLCLDGPRQNVRTPTQSVDRHEREAWIRLGMELLNEEDREIIVLRHWERISFDEAGERLGLTASGARMRYNRALGKLGDKVGDLRRGRVEDLSENP